MVAFVVIRQKIHLKIYEYYFSINIQQQQKSLTIITRAIFFNSIVESLNLVYLIEKVIAIILYWFLHLKIFIWIEFVIWKFKNNKVTSRIIQ